MSEFINNESKKRREQLKALILSVHAGKDTELAKKEFKEQFGEVSTKEISEMEQSLIKDDGVTIQEIQSLCDIHAAVFEGSISDIHNVLSGVTNEPGHPLRVFKEENEAIEKLIKEEIEPYLHQSGKTMILMLRIAFDRLWEIDKHYARKEYLFFPHLEKKGITAPPKVMWGVDDEIRADIKKAMTALSEVDFDEEDIKAKVNTAIKRVRDMIMKEDNILAPLLEENLKFFNWVAADLGSDEIGYFLERPKVKWNQEGGKSEEVIEKAINKVVEGEIPFSAGSLSATEVNAILNTVPVDMTFVDKDGHVKYFTSGKERLFPRPQTVIGRHVTMCHPPGSVDVVEEIISRLQSGKKDHEDFWIQMGPKFVHIRYFAVRDEQGEYLGVLEVSQDIKPLRELVGEKRLADSE